MPTQIQTPVRRNCMGEGRAMTEKEAREKE
jgi:hypothetical protein